MTGRAALIGTALIATMGMALPIAGAQSPVPTTEGRTELVLHIDQSSWNAWGAEIQIELAARGIQVRRGPPVEGASAEERDRTMEVAAEVGGGRWAARMETTPTRARTLRLLHAGSARWRSAVIPASVDGRTMGILLDGLVGEIRTGPAASARSSRSSVQLGVADQLGSPSEASTRSAAARAREPRGITTIISPSDERGLRFFGRAGIAGFAFVANDVWAGLSARGGVGLMIDRFEADVDLELGTFLEPFGSGGLAAQPVFRACVRSGYASPDRPRVRAGLLGCAGTLNTTVNGVDSLINLGAYLSIALPLSESVWLELEVDANAGMRSAVSTQSAFFFPELAGLLRFE